MRTVASMLITAPYPERELSAMSEGQRNAVSSRGNHKVVEERIIADLSGDVRELRQKVAQLVKDNHPRPLVINVTEGPSNRFFVGEWHAPDRGNLIEFIVYRTKKPVPDIFAMNMDELKAHLEKSKFRSYPKITGLETISSQPISTDAEKDEDVEVLVRIIGKDLPEVVRAAKQFIKWRNIYLHPFYVASNMVETSVRFFATKNEFEP